MTTAHEEFVKTIREQIAREVAEKREQELTPQEQWEIVKVRALYGNRQDTRHRVRI